MYGFGPNLFDGADGALRNEQFFVDIKVSLGIDMCNQRVSTEIKHEPICITKRWILAYFSFFCLFCLYGARVNVSIALPCTVKLQISNTTEEDRKRLNSSADEECTDDIDVNSASMKNWEFSWDKNTESLILSSYYFVYILVQIPSGILSDRYGGKRMVAIALTSMGITTLCCPIIARNSLLSFILLRVAVGACSGALYPGLYSIFGRWGTPDERSRLIAFATFGIPAGMCSIFFVSGYLCDVELDNGWPLIFYLTGTLPLLLLFPWLLLIFDTPNDHPRISAIEKEYIESNIGKTDRIKMSKLFWKSILTSSAFWAPTVAHCCSNWVEYTLSAHLPLFMEEVLKFSIIKNGTYSALTYVCYGASVIVCSHAADKISTSGLLSRIRMRKVFQSTALLGSGFCLLAAGHIPCNSREYAVLLLCLVTTFVSMVVVGYGANHMEYAPRYSGITFGISNALANISGTIATLINGILTPNGTQREWQNVFYIACAVASFGALIFSVFAKGEIQDWAKSNKEEDGMQDHSGGSLRVANINIKDGLETTDASDTENTHI